METLSLDPSQGELLGLQHWKPRLKKPLGARIFDFRIESFGVRDLDGNGADDIEVSIRERSLAAAKWTAAIEGLPFAAQPTGPLHAVVLRNQQGKLVMTGEKDRALLRRIASSTPRPG